MKKIFVLFSLVFGVMACNENEAPTLQFSNLIINGDFSNTSAPPWEFLKTGGDYGGSLTDEAFNSSNQAVFIEKASFNQDHFAFWGQSYTGEMPTGKDLELEVMVKGEQIEGAGVFIAIGIHDVLSAADAIQFATTQGNVSINGTFDWTPYSVTLENLVEGSQRITVFLIMGSNSSGKVYFDDVSLNVK